MENDLISRQAAIKALHDEIVRRRIDEDTNDDGTLDEFDTEAILRRLPSAQPEQIARDIATIIENEQDRRVVLKNAEHTKTHSCENQRTETHDLVSRDAVIKAILQLDNLIYTVPDYIDAVRSVPSWRGEEHEL